MIYREHKDSDFEDVMWLQQAYEKPCTVSELRDKLQNKSWVAEIGGCVIGNIICTEDFARILVWSLTVAPTYRRKGVGTALLYLACKHFADRNMYLYVDSENSAIKLYYDCGFRVLNVLENYYGEGLPAIQMVRDKSRQIPPL